MTYKVVVLPAAELRLERYIAYTRDTLGNSDAARNIAKDARKTKKRLSECADVLPLCQNEKLADLGYRAIRFERYDFFMVYRIVDNTVYVDGMYHDLQDFESIMLG